jgi:methionyl aminopeptidase
MMLHRRRQNIQIKTKDELEGMRKAGRLASECLQWITSQIEPGMNTQDIDDLQVQFVEKHGVRAAPLNYRGFPKSICTSINEVICHGIPTTEDVLEEGDIVGVDVTLIVDGFHGDNAATVPVGQVSPEADALMRATLEALRRGIAVVKPGKRLGDIGHAIQSFAQRQGYGVVEDFVGHGIGRKFHEEPQVQHVGKPRTGVRLRPGMTFTIEPMINQGEPGTRVLADGWTAVTTDGGLSAQYEHTIAVTPDGYEILTMQNGEGLWEPPGRAEIAAWDDS